MKSFSILGGKVHVVELPEGATDPFVSKTYIDEDGHVYNTAPQWLEWSGTYPDSALDLPPGTWRIIGMLSEVTEESAASIAEQVRVMNQPTKGYRTYNVDQYGNEGYFESAIKSLESAILAEGYLLESPPTPRCGCFGPAEEGACPDCDEYMKDQSRVLDRSRCLLLGRDML